MLSEFRSTNITWDKATSRIYSTVTANESDENGRKLVVQIVNGGQVENLTGAALHLYWETLDKLHDGLDVFKAVDLKKGEFELSYTTGMLSNKGVLKANLVLVDTVGRVVSERFKITVTEGIDNDAIQSENSFSSLTQALIDVSNLEQNYAPRLNDLTAQLQQTEQELSSQLAHRATKEEVETAISSIGNGSPKGTYATLSALQNAYPTGTTGIYVVTADGNWYYWSGSAWATGGLYQAVEAADKGIIEQKLASPFAKVAKSKNLFDRKAVTSGYYIASSTGIVTAETNYSYSEYIPIFGNTVYSRSITATHTCFYDKNKTFISGTTLKTYTTPVNAVYLRMSLPNATLLTEQLELGGTITSYEPYGDVLIRLKEGSIDQNTLQSLAIEKENMVGLNLSVNLLNTLTIKHGYTIGASGETLVVGWNHTDYIKVDPSTKYIATYAVGTFCAFYDINKNFLSILSMPTGTSGYILTTPSNAYYVRLNIQDAKLANYMFVEGETLPTEFVPFNASLDWLTLSDNSVTLPKLEPSIQTALNVKWKGKKIVTFGDSITWYDGVAFANTHIEYGQVAKGYQSYMREKLGCTVDNQGYSGAHIKLISSSKIKGYASYADVDAVTITSGANDHRIGFAPGTVQPIGSAFNLDTYAGAFQDAIEYLLAQKPSLKIYLITPIKGWFTAETTTRYNGENIISETYINIMKEIAELYSLPILDWYHASGINDLNYYVNGEPYYIGDNPAVWTAYQLHPTQIGFGRMGDMLMPFLNNN